MREFSWQYFARTGNLDAYLLYKAATERKGEENKKRSDQENTDENKDHELVD